MAESTATQQKYIVNELLTYITFYIRSPSDKIQTAVARFYMPAEIELARDILWEAMGEVKIGKKNNRKDSAARSANDANLADIIQALKIYMELDTNISFVARNIERMPKWGPEEISLFSIAERVSQLESELVLVKTSVNNINSTNHCLNSNIPKEIHNDNQIQHIPVQASISMTNHKPMSYSGVAAKPPPTRINEQNTKYPTSAIITNSSIRPTPDQQNKKGTNSKTRPKPIVGKKITNTIRGESRKTDIFLYRITHDTDDEEIKKLFKDANIPVFNLEKVSHDEAKMKSYKVTISLSDFDKVANDDFLPQDVMCRRFFKPRQRQQDEAHLNDSVESH